MCVCAWFTSHPLPLPLSLIRLCQGARAFIHSFWVHRSRSSMFGGDVINDRQVNDDDVGQTLNHYHVVMQYSRVHEQLAHHSINHSLPLSLIYLNLIPQRVPRRNIPNVMVTNIEPYNHRNESKCHCEWDISLSHLPLVSLSRRCSIWIDRATGTIYTHTHTQTGTFASKSVRVRLTRLSLGKWGMLSEITQCWSLTKKNGKPLSSPHCHWGCDLHRVVASCSLLFDELVRSLSILFFGAFGLLRHISYHRLSLVHDGTLTNYSMRVRDYAPRTLLTL